MYGGWHFARADVLARLIGSQIKREVDTPVAAIKTKTEVHGVLEDVADGLPITFKAIKEVTGEDESLREVKGYLLIKRIDSRSQGELLQRPRRRDPLMIEDSYIIFGDRTVVPKNIRPKCFETIPQRPSRYQQNEIVDSKLCLLAYNGSRHKK